MIYQVFHHADLYSACVKDNERVRPIGVGPAVSFCEKHGILHDKKGLHNVSHLNNLLSEWTAIYWLWRNLDVMDDADDWIGICHYRRPPCGSILADNCQMVESMLHKCDMISWIPNYNSLSNQAQKDHPGLIDLMASAISARHGEDDALAFLGMSQIPAFHPFSLCFIMKKENFTDFAAWSWKVIELLLYASSKEDSVIAGFDTKAPRGIGYAAERLLPAWCFLQKSNVLYTINGNYSGMRSIVDLQLQRQAYANV